jgi:hypothetical protein
MGRRSDAADQTGDVASAKRLADPALSSSDSGIVARWITGNDSSGGMKSKAMRCLMRRTPLVGITIVDPDHN